MSLFFQDFETESIKQRMGGDLFRVFKSGGGVSRFPILVRKYRKDLFLFPSSRFRWLDRTRSCQTVQVLSLSLLLYLWASIHHGPSNDANWCWWAKVKCSWLIILKWQSEEPCLFFLGVDFDWPDSFKRRHGNNQLLPFSFEKCGRWWLLHSTTISK